jgi:uncharacterized membrane protein (UPF0127 family)
MRQLATLILCLIFTPPPAWGGEVSLRIASQSIRAEIADTPHAREHGLMQRATLCPDCGMLFVFPVAKPYAFWMKDTPLPLSIAFIARDGRILNIAEMLPNTLEHHDAQGDALYALEMNRGWFVRHHVKPGDKISGLHAIPAATQ